MSAMLPAMLFCLAAVVTIGLHGALALGAPWGHMTMGGQVAGRLPGSMRVLSVIQALLLVFLCGVVIQAAGLLGAPLVPTWPWLIWVLIAISALALVANGITPSKPERAFGVPMALCMLVGSVLVFVSME